MNIWVVEFSVFPAGSHYYAKLHAPTGAVGRDGLYNLEYTLDEETAAALNRADRRPGWRTALEGDWTWEPGEPANRFITRDHAIEHAVVAFWLAADPDDVLVAGLSAVLDPQEPIAGHPARVAELRAFYDRAVTVDFYDGGPEERAEMDRIYEEYRAWQKAAS